MENTEDDIIKRDKEINPNCYYSKMLSQSCKYNNNNNNDNDKYICEVITNITRMCPNTKPEIIYSTKNQFNSNDIQKHNLFDFNQDDFSDLFNLNDIDNQIDEDIKEYMNKIKGKQQQQQQYDNDSIESNKNNSISNNDKYKIIVRNKPLVSDNDDNNTNEHNNKDSNSNSIFGWFSNNNNKKKHTEEKNHNKPSTKPSGRISGPEEDI